MAKQAELNHVPLSIDTPQRLPVDFTVHLCSTKEITITYFSPQWSACSRSTLFRVCAYNCVCVCVKDAYVRVCVQYCTLPQLLVWTGLL